MPWLYCVVLSALVSLPQQSTQPPAESTRPSDAPQARPDSALDPQDLPVSLDRIQRALARPPALQLKADTPVFRVEVVGRHPHITDFIGTDVFKGPVPRGSSAHQEFLAMVTPDDVRGYAAFSNREGITVAVSSLTSAMLISALQHAVRKLKTAVRERQKRAARQEVLAALAALERNRKAAGLQSP